MSPERRGAKDGLVKSDGKPVRETDEVCRKGQPAPGLSRWRLGRSRRGVDNSMGVCNLLNSENCGLRGTESASHSSSRSASFSTLYRTMLL